MPATFSTMLRSHILIALCLPLTFAQDSGEPYTVDGCPAFQGYKLKEDEDLPKCFCDNFETGVRITVTCLHRATISDIGTLLADARDNHNIDHIDEFYFDAVRMDAALTEETLAGIAIKQMSISDCQDGELSIADGAFTASRESLESLTINICDFKDSELPLELGTLQSAKNLTITNSRFIEVKKNAFLGLSSIESMDISRNLINSIEEGAFGNLSTLKYLDLSKNYHLNDSSQIAKILKDMPPIRNLSLIRCKLGELEPGMFSSLTQLESLDLTHNSLSTLPDNAFQGLSNLKILRLHINSINNTEPNAFAGLDNLEYLLIGGNYISAWPSELLKNTPNVRLLDLSYNEIEVLTAKMFAHANKVGELHLGYNYNLSVIEPGAFEGLQNTQRLFMQLNNLDVLEKDTFKGGLENLTLLDLSGGDTGDIDPGAFAGLNNLEELLLNNTDLTAIDASVFKDVPKLKRIHLYDNYWVCDTEIASMVEFLHEQYEVQGNIEVVDENGVYCQTPEAWRFYLVPSLNVTQLLTPEELANTTTVYIETTTPDLGEGQTIPYLMTGDEDAEHQKTNNKLAPIVIGVVIAMLLVTGLAVLVVVWMKKRKEEQAAKDMTQNGSVDEKHKRSVDTTTTSSGTGSSSDVRSTQHYKRTKQPDDDITPL